MTVQNPLIVPMAVEALVVNDPLRIGGNAFLRTQMEYNAMQFGCSAQPGLSDNDLNFVSTRAVPPNQVAASEYYNGVYLKWRLPQAFTTGQQSSSESVTTFPQVPNRWLVVRSMDGVATAWIIQSDFLWTSSPSPSNASQVGSLFVMAASSTDNTPVGTYIGTNFLLGSWTESGTSLGLTAFAPGNPVFAFYQPHCNNVFSFVDSLDSITTAQSLSYMVIGWFSNPVNDPLQSATPGTFAALLDGLDWALSGNEPAGAYATWSLLYGVASNVQWQNELPPPGGAPNDTVSVAVGNTSVEALTALVTAQASAGGESIDPDLLEAFQLGLLDLFDQPGGTTAVAEATQASFFQTYSAGTVWTIVDVPGAEPVSQTELEREEGLLASLNQSQASLDEAMQSLASLQEQLYVMWWKYVIWPTRYQGSTGIANLTQANLQNQLDPSVTGTLAQQVAGQMTNISGLLSDVPNGSTPALLQAAITQWQTANNLPSTRLLKASSLAPLYQPNDPVVLFAGAGASGIVQTDPTPITCRFPSEIVTSLTCAGTTVTSQTSGLTIPQPNVSGVSGAPWSSSLVSSLAVELFLIDPMNAAEIATAIGQSTTTVQQAMSTASNYSLTYPIGAFLQWTQNPWHPLLLVWEATYYPLSYGTTANPNWTFSNGQYSWNGSAESVGAPMTLQGTIHLSSAAAFNMQARITAFLANTPELGSTDPAEANALQDLLGLVQTDDAWDLLSQSLNGFGEQLQLSMPGVYTGPSSTSLSSTPPLPDLIGNAIGNPPGLGNVPIGAPPASSFQPWRFGQFYFTNLLIVDEWGQAVWPISPANDTVDTLYLPPEFEPTSLAVNVAPNATVQLPPAVLQPGSLLFQPVSVATGTVTDDASTAVSGWVLPNHLDQSLMFYDAAGVALGELAAGTSDEGAPSWTAAPNSPYPTLNGLSTGIAYFGPFVFALSQQSVATFQAFLDAIDETLWTTAPLDAVFDPSLASLIGRPLAFVQASLQFQFAGMPTPDPSWQFTFDPAPAAITTYSFPIQLGNISDVEDGLIGYFISGTYTTFFVVEQSGATPDSYLSPITGNYITLPFNGPLNGTTAATVSMLVDPRASVHATTGILPAPALSLPPSYVNETLDALTVTFRVNGLLTDQVIASDGTATILVPAPQERTGSWSWMQLGSSGDWDVFPIAPNDPTARLSTVPPVLRSGMLQLSSALGDAAGPDARRRRSRKRRR